MKVKYTHTNIIAKDWKKLAFFYKEVLECTDAALVKNLSGNAISTGTGVKNAKISGIHLLLPGHGKNSPTLEIFQYSENKTKPPAAANREGITHLAFEVDIDDLESLIEKVIKHNGSKLGDLVSIKISDTATLKFIYMTDPEGNIIELQSFC